MTSATKPVSTQHERGLAGQTVVVIGGSAGIGLETARRARAEGADVILTGRTPDRLTEAALELGAQRTAAFDANDAAALERFLLGLPTPIDHVMVTAGGPRYGPRHRLRRHRRAAPVHCGPGARARAGARQPHRRWLRRHPAVGLA